jgi:TonB-linked SusC/RagA family outer membrane protein
MKHLRLFAVSVLLVLCSSLAFGQSTGDRITANLREATLSEAISVIQKSTSYKFFYDAKSIDLGQKVSLVANNVPVQEAVTKMLAETGIKCSFVGHQIALTQQQQPSKPVCSGKILDNTGQPVIGGAVMIKGSTKGAVTSEDGTFTFPEAKIGDVLEISCIGFQTKEITWNGGPINTKIDIENHLLDEVVVVGYGSQKKVDVIGSIASINSKNLESRPAPDVTNMLTGQMSGVSVTQTTGKPGADAGTIRVRGVGSFGATPEPLVLIDGLVGSLSDLNPSEIDNISVLKDASSAAIYGSRSANGVILITTKHGAEGKTRVTYNGSVGVSEASELPELAHTYDFATYYNMAVGTEAYSAAAIQAMKDGSDRDNYADENYLEELLGGHAMQTKHEVTLSGGTNTLQYIAAGGYLHQDGLVDHTYFDKYNARLNVNAQIAPKLKFSSRVSGVFAKRNEASTPGSVNVTGLEAIVGTAVRYPGLFPTKLSNGNYGRGSKSLGTPLAWVDSKSFISNATDKFSSGADLTYTPIKGLNIKVMGGYNFSLLHYRSFADEIMLDGGIDVGPENLTDRMSRTVYKTFQATADYTKTIARKHNISAIVGYTWEDESNRYISGSRLDFPSNEVPYLTAGSSEGETNTGSGYDWALQSVFGRFTYNYDERYLFEATARYDGSSRFPTSHRYGFFPSVALGWRVSQEPFWRDLNMPWFSNLKLKASVGVLGNNEIGNYPYQSVYELGASQNYVFGGTFKQGASITTYVDPNLKWERTRTSDIGVETGFFDGKLTFNASYYYRKTFDILYKPSASYSSVFGLDVSEVNTGELVNKGLEFEIGHQNQIGNFNYHINANLTYLHNEVMTLGVGNVTQANGLVGNGSNLFIGYPMQMFYGYKTDGVFLSDAEVASWSNQSAIAPNSKAGDIRYVDLDGDKDVDADDRTYLGSSIPKYTFGISAGASWKNLDFSFLIQGVSNVKAMLSMYAEYAFYQEGTIQKWQMDGCWNVQKDNRYPAYPGLEAIQKGGSNNTLISDWWVVDASYLKVRNVQLGYTLPKQWVSKFKVNALRAYISVDNPLSFNNFRKGWDPETATLSGNSSNDGSYYPVLRTYTFGLTLNF